MNNALNCRFDSNDDTLGCGFRRHFNAAPCGLCSDGYAMNGGFPCNDAPSPKSLGCHFEHTVLVTEDGYEILTQL